MMEKCVKIETAAIQTLLNVNNATDSWAELSLEMPPFLYILMFKALFMSV